MSRCFGSAAFALASAFILAACSQADKATERAFAPGSAQRAATPGASAGTGTGRYVATRNFIVIETEAAQVPSLLKAAQDRCAPPDCEILESSITREFRDAPPSARLRLRIAPKASEAFVNDLVARGGDLIERRIETEDRTDQVVDVEARLKNMTELRDRLRKLLSSPAASVKDLVELESQLARVQTDLDSASGRRQALANETEKVSVAIDIRSHRVIAETGVLGPIKAAITGVGHTFAQSLAALIAFIVAVLPWLALAVPIIWLWRRWRRRKRVA